MPTMEMERPMITVIQKAANVCAYCRVRKQKCDRVIPTCSRCATKERPCDYTPAPELRHQSSHDSDFFLPLFTNVTLRGPDLSSRGRSELLQAISDCVNHVPGSILLFSELVTEILDLANVTISSLVQEYASCMQRWIPLVTPAQLLQDPEGKDQLPSPLLLLSMFLVTRRPVGYAEQLRTGVLYTTIKQIHATLQSSGEVQQELVQSDMIVAVYELAHGMSRQAYMTLGACVAMVTLLDFGTPRSVDVEDNLNLLHVAILVLDRALALCTLDNTMPLICPTSHPISSKVWLHLSTHEIGPRQTDPILKAIRKLKVQAQVTLATGRVLEWVHFTKRGDQPKETYEVVDQNLAAVVRSLVQKQESHSWLICDCISMGFSALILLHHTRVASLPDPSVDPKALLALAYFRRMAWEMNVLLIEKLKHEFAVSHLPFGGLCCAVRAAVAVVESGAYGAEESITARDIEGILDPLRKFEKGWRIGTSYRRRVESAAIGV